MKIDPRVQLPSDAQSEQVKSTRPSATKSQGTSQSSDVHSTAGQDTVSISRKHQEVQTLAANLANVPEVRAERIGALRQKVQSGNYHPDSGEIADSLIADHSKLNIKA